PYGFTKLSYYEFLIPQYENDQIVAYRYIGNDGTSSFFVRQVEDNTTRYINDHTGSELTYAYSTWSFTEGDISRTFNSKGLITKLTYNGIEYGYNYTVSGGCKYLSSIWIMENANLVNVRTFTKNATATITYNGNDTETFEANGGSFIHGDIEVTPYADTVTVKDSQKEEKLVLTLYSNGKIKRVRERPFNVSTSDTRLPDLNISYGKAYTLVKNPGEDLIFSTSDDIITKYLFDVNAQKITVISYTDSQMEDIDSMTVYDNSENGSVTVSDGNRENLFGKTELTGTTYSNVSLSTSVRKYNSASYLFTGNGSVRKDLSSLTAGTYTVSAYVKLDGLTASSGGLKMVTGLGETEYLKGTTPADIHDGWQRIFLTVDVPAGSFYVEFKTEGVTSGTAYVSAVQVEKSAYPTPYDIASGWNDKTVSGIYSSVKTGFVRSVTDLSESGRTYLLQMKTESGIVSPRLSGYIQGGNTVPESGAEILAMAYCYDGNHNMESFTFTASFDPFEDEDYPVCLIHIPEEYTLASISVYAKLNRVAGEILFKDFSLREVGYYGSETEEYD
ncbi:MAG: hypothetical protein II529_03560, partial [Erysipelotrichaceae bacterium]|nr:hypothetical protein [Erysipelotrichaceae bacterium]